MAAALVQPVGAKAHPGGRLPRPFCCADVADGFAVDDGLEYLLDEGLGNLQAEKMEIFLLDLFIFGACRCSGFGATKPL
ncbi:MAG: hypothetical protein FJ077_09465 [Cyanobacteria bacterium K_DeepCast_35m_m2_023]|nr:hypothetical protein [Cyanobacteria bacterium K_DeepCast_35m_m2_023]